MMKMHGQTTLKVLTTAYYEWKTHSTTEKETEANMSLMWDAQNLVTQGYTQWKANTAV